MVGYRAAAGILLVAAIACGGTQHAPGAPQSDEPSDAGTSLDAGAEPHADGGTAPPDGGTADGGVPSPDAGLAINPDKELAIVDPAIVLDRRASNEADGPWSFRWQMEQMAGARAPQMVEAWLRTLRSTSVDGATVEERPGVEGLLSAWPRAQDGSLDLARSPFRLLGIFNRMDLAGIGRAEARFVFGLVDPATEKPGLMTVGLEYRLPLASELQEWARRWHALADYASGEPYAAALEALTRTFTSAAVDGEGVNGSALAQLRTNEAQFGAGWELRQWVLDRDTAGAVLRPVLTPRTPSWPLNDSAQLAQWLLDNAAAVRSGRFELPRALTGGAARETEAWTFRSQTGVDEPLRHAFAAQTCNGCHSSETDSARGFFHVDPLAPPGRGRLSGFLRESQLPQREKNLASLLAGGPPIVPRLPPLPERSVQYDLIPVPAGEDSRPVALDARGNVLGNSPAGPWIWNGATVKAVGYPGLTATGFNSDGDVVGYEGSGARRVAILHSSGVKTTLGSLGGSMSLATGINASRLVAGDSLTASGAYHGFLFGPGPSGLRDLGTLGGAETMTSAINAAGQITGESQAADGTRHAFLADASGVRDLGTLGGRFTLGQAINDKGQVAGMSETVPGDKRIHAFFHDGSVMHDLGSLPGLPWTSAPGLNNNGVVVGNVYNKPDYGRTEYDTAPFVWRGGVMRNLNELVPPSSVKLLTVLGINDAGQILCSDGQADATTAHGYLLQPR